MRLFICSNSGCPAGDHRVLTMSTNEVQWCCGQPMDSAVYEAAERPGQLGTLAGRTVLDVFVCIDCRKRVTEAADVDPDHVCPDCRRPRMVRFGS